jgi:hypothetical protein
MTCCLGFTYEHELYYPATQCFFLVVLCVYVWLLLQLHNHIPWWWKCVWFHNVEFAMFSCLCVCNVLLKYIFWSSNTKKNLGIGWESKSRSMEIWCHEFFMNWIGWIGKESNLFLGPVWFKISWCVFVGILEVFVFTTKAWRMMSVVGKLMELVLV